MNKVILVTGGAGYIGSHTCKALSLAGHIPVTVDNLVYGHTRAVRWGDFIECDILDTAALTRVFEKYSPLAVIHFAAFAYVGESVKDSGKYYRNNLAGTVSLLETMRKTGCQKIIFSSTCATYGIPDTVPITEQTPQNPVNPYGRTKLMIEQILKDYDSAYGMKHIILRYFNAAGADPDGEIGEDHDPETHLIPLAMKAALGRRPYLEVYGTDYPTPDGTAIRDYIHVTDLAEAHVKSLNLLTETRVSHIFNLGTGTGHSVREVIRAVEEVCGITVPVREAPRRPGDPPVLIASADKAREILEWKPRHSDIGTVAETAWRWHSPSVPESEKRRRMPDNDL